MKIVRQGDVLLKQISTLPNSVVRAEGPCVLAYGEATGHAHQVRAGGELWVDVNDEPLVMIKVLNSTPDPDGHYQSYFLRVPPDMTQAHEAVVWTFGLTKDEYAPVFES